MARKISRGARLRNEYSQLLVPLIALLLIILFNLFRDPSFFSVGIAKNNVGYPVLQGNLISILNGASELAILAMGMTLVTAACGGQDISVGAVAAIAGSVFVKVLRGAATITPLTVALGILSGIVVAIIGFTLTFGAFVYDHMAVSVSRVDRGQIEAAYALGYTKNKTFFRIVFPQAMSIFLPSYCGQAVELIKATAVVGYVAVNDLTKMGDIIRSNTYEAFFPLIATAVIYFLLTWTLAALLKLVKRRFEPKRRSQEDILNGVKTV